MVSWGSQTKQITVPNEFVSVYLLLSGFRCVNTQLATRIFSDRDVTYKTNQLDFEHNFC